MGADCNLPPETAVGLARVNELGWKRGHREQGLALDSRQPQREWPPRLPGGLKMTAGYAS